MQIIQRLAQLLCVFQHFLFRKGMPFVQQLAERLPRNKVHHRVDSLPGLDKIKHLRQIRVMQILQNIHLRTAVLYTRSASRKLFQHHRLLQTLMDGPEHGSRPSCADLLIDLVCTLQFYRKIHVCPRFRSLKHCP